LAALDELSEYWEVVREYYRPFDVAPRTGSAEVYLHEMPGGQYTNLKEQAASMGVSHRWHEIARFYAEVNKLFGDIVKVTPSSKVVGDMALFLFSRGIQPQDVVNLEPGVMPFPESVIDMFNGGLGWPPGGWPETVWKVVLGEKGFKEAKARYQSATRSSRASKASGSENEDLVSLQAELTTKLKRPCSDDDLYSHLMYPLVFAAFEKHRHEFGDVSVLPTPAFFYGLRPRQEISATIEQGKTLIIRLVNVSEPDKEGRRTVTYELNGMTRETVIADKSLASKVKHRPKADLTDSRQIPAPIPGLIASISVTVGHKVSKGDKLLMMEAMKMQTTVSAPIDGVVEEIYVSLSDTVESKDLLMKLRG
jgi:pyruvate carboxylase